MTIDEALNKMPCLMEACSHCLVRGCDKPIEKIDEAKIVAIDTMRKYQKIQKILNSASYVENGTVYSYTYDEDSRIKHIREVIEDGKID